MAGTTIREIKAATDSGMKLAPGLRDRLILSALVELYEASAAQTQALEKHIKDSTDDMNNKIKEHDHRIEKLERHDLVRFATEHPKMTLFILSAILFLVVAGEPILSAFGVVIP